MALKSLSHSQFSAYNSCNLKWKLRYIDKLSLGSGSIHTIFGSAMHTVLQSYLTTFYEKSIKEAESLPLELMLKNEMIKEFTIIRKRFNVDVCNQKDLTEFYEDGVEIIKGFKKDRAKYFMKKNYELVGIELPIFTKLQDGVQFRSYLDVVIRNKINDNIKIIDLKTSTRSWSHFQKKDFYKTSQLILYKQFYADKFDVPLDKISVEFLILKRKVAKKSDWPISRLQRFEPANGSVTLNKVAKAFDEFRTLVFEEDGNYKTDREYPAKPGNACKFCEFYDTEHCKWGKIL
jgi:predicted nucleic-acid-binding Zn-ribbon protein